MEFNEKEINRLFDETIKNIESLEESIMFNLYEDEDFHTMETTFDDESFVVCRDNPAKLCKSDVNYIDVLKFVKNEICKFIKNNENNLKQVKEISYGFVDGDLHYIKKKK